MNKHYLMKSRRDFVKTTTLLGASLALAPNMAFGMSSPKKEKLNIALIGVGLRGTNHLTNLLQRNDVNIVAICDIDSRRIDLCLDLIKKASQTLPKTFGKDTLDYRNLLALPHSRVMIHQPLGGAQGQEILVFYKVC